MSWFSKGTSVFVVLLSILFGYLHFSDPLIDIRIKLITFLMNGLFTYATRNGVDKLDRSILPVNRVPLPVQESNLIVEDFEVPLSEIDAVKTLHNYNYTSVKVRLFAPTNEEKKHPVLVYFHGGGYTIGAADDLIYHGIGTFFASNLSYFVVSVDYHLAPEFKFPAQLVDTVSAISWASSTQHPLFEKYADQNDIHIGGDSAGGHLSLISARFVRDELPNIKIQSQILIYPSTGSTTNEVKEDPKFKNGGWILPLASTTVFRAAVLGLNYEYLKSDLWNAFLFKSYENLPRTLLLVGTEDPLTKAALELKDKFIKANVPVKTLVYENAVHGFFSFSFLPSYHLSRKDIIEYHLSQRKLQNQQ